MLVYLVGSDVVLAELEAGVGIEQEQPFQLLRYYHPATRGVHPHNYRTPIESGVFAHLTSTRHNACNTNQVLTKSSATTRSLALSLALRLAIVTPLQQPLSTLGWAAILNVSGRQSCG